MRALSFKRFERGTLRGFADLLVDGSLVLLGCTLHERNESRWVNPPGRPQLDSRRQLVTADDGKIKYSPVIDFVDGKARTRWSDAAVEAIDAFLAYLDSKAPATEAGAMNGESVPERLTKDARDG
jgi:hypothetical protein